MGNGFCERHPIMQCVLVASKITKQYGHIYQLFQVECRLQKHSTQSQREHPEKLLTTILQVKEKYYRHTYAPSYLVENVQLLLDIKKNTKASLASS